MKLLVPILAAGIAIGGAAEATTLTFTNTIVPQPTPFSAAFTLNSFNTALGTLTGVEIIVDDTAAVEVDIFNATGSPKPFTNASAVVPLSVTGPGGVNISNSVTAGPISGTATTLVSTFPGLFASNVVTQTLAPSVFSAYEGTGLQDLAFNVSSGNGTFSGTAGSGLFFGGSAAAGGTIVVDYTYTPIPTVPEPASWTLMIAGFGAMGGVLRKRRGPSATAV